MESDMSNKTEVKVPHGKGVEWWKGLAPVQKKALVYHRLTKGDSNPALATEFGISSNSIASLRDKWNKTGKPNPYALVLTGTPTTENAAAVTKPVSPPVETDDVPLQPVESPNVNADSAEKDRAPKVTLGTSTEVNPLECQWPTGSGSGLKVLAICREPAVDGLCEKHRSIARRYLKI